MSADRNSRNLMKALRTFRDTIDTGKPSHFKNGFISGINLAINIISLYPEEVENRLEKAIEYQKTKRECEDYKSGIIAGLSKALEIVKKISQAENWVIVSRTAKGYMVIGNTYPIKDRLKNLGGRWDSFLQAWIFRDDPTSELENVEVIK